MTRVTIDPATAAQLSGLSGATELCDANGNTVGVFQPSAVLSTNENTPNISSQDLDRFEREAGGRSLQEIVKDLAKRS